MGGFREPSMDWVELAVFGTNNPQDIKKEKSQCVLRCLDTQLATRSNVTKPQKYLN